MNEATDIELDACPSCGARKGVLQKNDGSRFPYTVHCRACGWSTNAVTLEGVAVKLWNQAKRKGKRKGERTPRTAKRV